MTKREDKKQRKQERNRKRIRISVFKPTNDDWYPSYQIEGYWKGIPGQLLVEVSFLELLDGQWRVCIWGADDCGYEQDFTDQGAAYEMFEHVVFQEHVDKEWLIAIHFVHV